MYYLNIVYELLDDPVFSDNCYLLGFKEWAATGKSITRRQKEVICGLKKTRDYYFRITEMLESDPEDLTNTCSFIRSIKTQIETGNWISDRQKKAIDSIYNSDVYDELKEEKH